MPPSLPERHSAHGGAEDEQGGLDAANAEPASRNAGATSSTSPSSSSTPAGTPGWPRAAKEQVTAERVAAVVKKHLGAAKVTAFGSYDDERELAPQTDVTSRSE
jgi:hypothetical protein